MRARSVRRAAREEDQLGRAYREVDLLERTSGHGRDVLPALDGGRRAGASLTERPKRRYVLELATEGPERERVEVLMAPRSTPVLKTTLELVGQLVEVDIFRHGLNLRGGGLVAPRDSRNRSHHPGYPTAMSEQFDIVVVGAGPCGIAVGASAKKAGLSCVLFDRGCVTSSLVNYPYYMTFFSTAVMLEVGGVPFTIPEAKPTRREALAYYRRVIEHWDLDVRQYEDVVSIEGGEGDYSVATRTAAGMEHSYLGSAVVIATGGFHDPNYLGVPGEDLPKVHHYYHEPYPYYDQDVLVVGAGSSAVEAALEMFRNGARVTIVHFLEKIDRGVKPWIVPDITNRLEKGEIPALWRHRVAEIRPSSVVLRSEEGGTLTEISNDFVVAMTGWRANHEPLEKLGVEIGEANAIPRYDPATMETNVPGLYIAGVIAAGHDANKIFIENGREHGDLIVAHRLKPSYRVPYWETESFQEADDA